MHAFSVFLTTMAIASTALAGSVLEARDCPPGPFKIGSKCGQECHNVDRCSSNLQNVVRSLHPSSSGISSFHFFPRVQIIAASFTVLDFLVYQLQLLHFFLLRLGSRGVRH